VKKFIGILFFIVILFVFTATSFSNSKKENKSVFIKEFVSSKVIAEILSNESIENYYLSVDMFDNSVYYSVNSSISYLDNNNSIDSECSFRFTRPFIGN